MIALLLALLGAFLILAGLFHFVAGISTVFGVIVGLVCILVAVAVGSGAGAGWFHRNP